MDNLSNSVSKAFRWNTFVEIIEQSFTFIISVILARILDPHDFGLFSMTMVFIGFIKLFKDFGLSQAIIQKQDVEDRHIHSVYWFNLIIGFCSMLVMMYASSYIASFYNEPILQPILIVISSALFLDAINLLPMALLVKSLNYRAISNIRVGSYFITGIIAIVLAYKGFGVWSIVLQFIITPLFNLIVRWIVFPWFPKWYFDIAALKEIAKFGGNLMASRIVRYWVKSADNLLLGKYTGAITLSIYSRGYNLMFFGIKLFQGFGLIICSTLSKLQDKEAEFHEMYLRMVQILIFMMFPVMTGMMVVSDLLVIALYGEKWRAVIPILQILCGAGLLILLEIPVHWVFYAKGKVDIQLKWEMFAGITRVVLIFFSLTWGSTGVACSLVLGTAIFLYPLYKLSCRLINLNIRRLLACTSSIFCCNLFMATMVLVSKEIFTGGDVWYQLMINVAVGVFSYLAFAILFQLNAYKEFKIFLNIGQ